MIEVKIFRNIFLLILSVALTGCATTGQSGYNTYRECPIDMYVNGTNPTQINYYENLQTKAFLFEKQPTKQYSGIASANIDGSTLHIQLNETGLFEEYKTDTKVMVTHKYYPPRYVGALLGTIISGGTFWLLDKDYASRVLGCRQTTRGGIEYDATHIKTGKTKWAPYHVAHSFRVTGLNKSFDLNEKYSLNQQQTPNNGSYAFDIDHEIQADTPKSSITLKVECIDCVIDDGAPNDIKNLSKTINISSEDLRNLKSKSKKESNDTANKLANDSEISKLKQLIDETKEKCKDLGFKPKTEKFSDCVLKLSK